MQSTARRSSSSRYTFFGCLEGQPSEPGSSSLGGGRHETLPPWPLCHDRPSLWISGKAPKLAAKRFAVRDREAKLQWVHPDWLETTHLNVYSDGQTLRNGFGNFLLAPATFSFLSAVPIRYLSFLSVDPDCYSPIQHLELFAILRNIFQHLETFCSTSPTAIHDRSCVSRLV